MRMVLLASLLVGLSSCLGKVVVPADERLDHFMARWEIEESDVVRQEENPDGSWTLFMKPAYAEGIEEAIEAGLGQVERGGIAIGTTILTVFGLTLLRRWRMTRA